MAAQNNPVPNADKHLFASYSHVSAGDGHCRSAHLCRRVPLSLARSIYRYHNYIAVCNWAEVKSKEFGRLGHLVEQLFCIVLQY